MSQFLPYPNSKASSEKLGTPKKNSHQWLSSKKNKRNNQSRLKNPKKPKKLKKLKSQKKLKKLPSKKNNQNKKNLNKKSNQKSQRNKRRRIRRRKTLMKNKMIHQSKRRLLILLISFLSQNSVLTTSKEKSPTIQIKTNQLNSFGRNSIP